MSRMAFLTRVFARSHDVPPSRSRGGREAPVYFWTRSRRYRHEQLVLPGVAELQELLHGVVGDANLLQADEHPDAVIDVHDEVVDFEIAEIREKGLGRRAPP